MKNIYKIGMSALSLAAALSLTACSSSAATNTSASSSNGSSSSSVLHDANGDGKLVVYGIYKSGDQTWFLNEGKAAKAYV